MTDPGSYRAAGVDVAAGERAVRLIAEHAATAGRPEVVGGLGGFAGLFALDTSRWRRPLLATSTDGVGTKLVIAQRLNRHDTVGLDLVGMVVDDIVVTGAEPLFLTDYIACGRLVPERIAEIVSGVAAGCRLAGCALIGGETAEHPGVLQPDQYDLAGAGVGVVEADALLGAHRVARGDGIVAMASSGLHANGYSLVRRLLAAADVALDATPAELAGRTVGEELLVPTRIYAPDCLALAADLPVHAFAHVTGGGLAANLARVVPAGLTALVDRGSWSPPPAFRLLRRLGVPAAEMERTFNMGVGMVALLPGADAAAAVRFLTARSVPAWVAGEVRGGPDGNGAAELVGSHPD